MPKNKKILAIIPARGGSKGIPGKNIKNFAGKPLIAWTILSALKSKVDKIIVTTDDPQIAEAAKKHGAEVPFLRPKHLASDHVAIVPVIKHAVKWLKNNENYHPDGIALLYPTNPLRQAEHINQAIEIFTDKQADCVFSVSEIPLHHHPYWMLKKTPDNHLISINNTPLKKKKLKQRQQLPTFYFRNDIIYLFRPGNLEEKPSNVYSDKIEFFITDEIFNGDINILEDWHVTLEKFKRLKKCTKTRKF